MSRRASFLLLAACLGWGGAARADDTSDLQALLNEQVITTASKTPETAGTAPATSTTLSAEDMHRYGIHTVAEALDYLSLGVWTSDSLFQVDAGARGVMLSRDQGNHFLLLVDGHAMNEQYFGIARFDRGAGIPLEMVDHIEVILGPGSVLYGSNAMLGVINIITKRAKDFAGVHAVVETELGGSYGYRAAAGAGYELHLFSAPTEITAMAEYYNQVGPGLEFPLQSVTDPSVGGVYRPSRTAPLNSPWGGTASHTGGDEPAGLLRIVQGNLDVSIGASAWKRSAAYDDLDFQALTYFDDPTQYQLDRHAWFDAKYHATLSQRVQIQARLYGDSFDYQRRANTSGLTDCLYPGTVACRAYTLELSRWGGLEVQSSFDWLGNARLVTLVGVDGRLRSVGSETDTFDYDTGRALRSSYGVVDTQDQVLGAYLQQTWDPVPWLALNAGARVDRDVRFPAQISPRLAASVTPWHDGKIKAIYAEAFRAPSWGETTYSGPNQILAESLRPETVRSVELSLEQKSGAQKLLFGVFRSWWHDLIELDTLSQAEVQAAQESGQLTLAHGHTVVQFRNVASIDNYGFNGGFEGASGSLRYALNLTGAAATRTNPAGTARPIALAPRLVGNARVSYDLPGLLPTLALAAQGMTARPADRAFDYGFSPQPFAPTEVSLRATVSGKALLGLSYRVSGDWLTSAVAPYVIGPRQTTDPADPQPYALAPTQRLRVMLTLAYDGLP